MEPFTGQVIDGPMNEPAPGAWEMQIDNKLPPYQCGQTLMEVPNTATVKTCHTCVGRRRQPCPHCVRTGKVQHITSKLRNYKVDLMVEWSRAHVFVRTTTRPLVVGSSPGSCSNSKVTGRSRMDFPFKVSSGGK